MKIYGNEEVKLTALLNSKMFKKNVKEVKIKSKIFTIYYENKETKEENLYEFYKMIKYILIPSFYSGKIPENITFDKLLDIYFENI